MRFVSIVVGYDFARFLALVCHKRCIVAQTNANGDDVKNRVLAKFVGEICRTMTKNCTL